MEQRELTREQCENKILKHLKAIQQLYRRYNPDGEYLALGINGNHISANNAYWEDTDKERPLDFFCIDGEKICHVYDKRKERKAHEKRTELAAMDFV